MKKTLAIIIASLLVISTVFVACTNKDDVPGADESTSSKEQSTGGLDIPVDEYGFEKDEQGNEVVVKYEKDKNGNVIAHVVDEQGNKTDVTVPANNYVPDDEKDKQESQTIANNTTTDAKEDESVTNNTDDEKNTTDPELTTVKMKNDRVPKTSDKGKPVQFSDKDILTVSKILQVPYLYTANYEANEEVPVAAAKHVAIWMAQNDGNTNTTFPQGTILLNLFVYFGTTVRNFSTECNTIQPGSVPAPISYNQSTNIFTITSYESKTHSIDIEEIQAMGNNNYYKVIANVTEENDSGCDKKKLVAIIQKNKLNSRYRYSFSVKAMQWS